MTYTSHDFAYPDHRDGGHRDRTCTECGLRDDNPVHAPECMNGPEHCHGPVEYRMPLSGTGRSFPRCDLHWAERLVVQEGIDARYPTHAPSNFDPAYAGESWDEDR